MTSLTHTIRRLTAMLGLVGVALAIAAPAALAGHQDLGTEAAAQQIQGTHHKQGAGTLVTRRAHAAEETPDAIERYLRNNPRQDRPGDRAGTRGIGEQTVAVDTSDAVSRYLRNNPAPDRTAAGPGAFDWRDAGIGAGSALVLMLTGLGCMLIVLRRKPTGTGMLSS